MKNILALALLILAAGCTPDAGPGGDLAKITGVDYRKCMCCGGYFITIEGTNFRFASLPQDSGLDINADTTFPMLVRLNWKSVSTGCGGDNMIEVIRITKL